MSLLLYDGTVWFAGGNPERGSYEDHMEIYQPAYLFNSDGTLATRPTISQRTQQYFLWRYFYGADPERGKHCLGSIDARWSGDSRLRHGPANGGDVLYRGQWEFDGHGTAQRNIAPPGYYMLFLLNSSGVPSVATFVQLNLCYLDVGH